jgi:hypothetical protein
MDKYIILVILSALVIFSYLFDMIARKTRFPSVLLLLATGIVIRLILDYWHIPGFNFIRILPTLGTIGLILIVLEGALELKYERRKINLILNSFLSALMIFIISSTAIAFFFRWMTGYPLLTCYINAIPYSIISSAIAIPSSSSLSESKKEFVVYESTFSDIIGVVVFNFFIFNQDIQISSFLLLSVETIFIVLISIIFCLALLYLIQKIKHQVKFFLVLSILVLVYSAGHFLHLPSLIMVLFVGLFLNNASQITYPVFRRHFMYEGFSQDLAQFFKLSAESAFLVRTFFFIIFGFIINLNGINDQDYIRYSLLILAIIYILRAFYLKFIARMRLLPLLFLSPRGLISILLFLSIPAELTIPGADTSLLFLVILGSSLVMSVGLVSAGKPVAKE